MKTYLDCIPCFFRQTLEAARFAGADEILQKEILDRISREVPDFPLESSPPEMGQIIYTLIKEMTGREDPYREVKRSSNQLALQMLPQLHRMVARNHNRLLMAVRLAIAGNIIDYGAVRGLNIERELERILQMETEAIDGESATFFNYSDFRNGLQSATDILYLGDNAGEIVFDRILLEEIRRIYPHKEIRYAVKEKPIINDALREDAIVAGIDKIAIVISSGSDAPGTVLSRCSPEFLKLFEKAGMVISKGQGNFEALSSVERPIHFLFMAKCPVIARDIGCEVGDIILYHR